MNPHHVKNARRDALVEIERVVGRAALPCFLSSRQPELGDRTGAELLNEAPGELLLHLRRRGAVCDPVLDRLPARRSERETAGILAILDALNVEGEVMDG